MPNLKVLDRPYPRRDEILRAHPIADFVRARGFELKAEGSNFTTSGCPVCRHEKPGHRPVTLYADKQHWYCHDCKQGGSVIDWVMIERNVSVGDAIRELSVKTSASRIVATYDYRDEESELLFQCVRYEPKDFKQRRPDGKGDWIWNLQGVRRVLYRLPELLQEIRNGLTIFIPEGEKDVEALRKHGLPATCNPLGAGKWADQYTATLRGADVVIIADKDKDGRDHAQLVASKLHGSAAAVRVIELPQKDASDFFASEGTVQQLIEISDKQPEWIVPDEVGRLPALVDISGFFTREASPLPPLIIHHLLHQGSKMLIGGESKGRKTFALIDIALSVSCNAPWWGFNTSGGRVCYINLEIQPQFFEDRVRKICEVRNLWPGTNMFYVWNLRGYAKPMEELINEVLPLLKKHHFKLVIIDPVYKTLPARHGAENDSALITALLNKLELVSVQTGAAVLFATHFSKGNQAEKEAMDRVSGSGAWARDPDSLLTMTPHKHEECFVIEGVVRNLAPIRPFVVKWDYPLFVRQQEMDPDDLKGRKSRGAPPTYQADDIKKYMSLIHPITVDELRQKPKVRSMSKTTFYRYFDTIETEETEDGFVLKSRNSHNYQE